MPRLIFHVDVNNAFLSWESVKRLEEDPQAGDLRLIPAAIGGDRESRKGIILAKSQPAKVYGIKTGEPIVSALRKCPELYLTHADFAQYTRCSKGFMAICRKYAPVVEPASIDECYLDMSGTERLYGSALAIAGRIAAEVREELGFTVNIGISENKFLAKMASDFQKPDRIHTLYRDQIAEKMWPLPIEELLYAGKATCERLRNIGIRTIGELAQSSLSIVQNCLGRKGGLSLHAYANGLDESPVLAEVEAPKGYGNSITLPYDFTEYEEVWPVLLSLCESVARRLRADHIRAGGVSVLIKSSTFEKHSHQRILLRPTNLTEELYESVKQLFVELWDRLPIRLLGVTAGHLEEGDYIQQTLFDTEAHDKQEKLDRMMDHIRDKHGNAAVLRGTFLQTDIWKHVGSKHREQLKGEKGRDEG